MITDNDSEEEITVYGISENSNYAKINIKDGALISEGYHEKYGIDKGDTITLVEKYTGTKHRFKVKDITTTQQHYPYSYLKKNSARNLIYRMVHLTDISPTK